MSQRLALMSILLLILLPTSLAASDRALSGENAETPLASHADNPEKTTECLDLGSGMTQSQFGEELMLKKGGQEAGVIGGCNFRSCDVSVECYEGCELLWCDGTPPYQCDAENPEEENFCWCVRSCADYCA